MITTLISFFGGSAFRVVWAELAAWFTKRQDHSQEVERIRLQGELDAQAHARNLESLKLQSDLGVKVIEMQSSSNVKSIETDAWLEAVKGTTQKVGIAFVDAWNGVIRPLVATWAVVMVTIHYANHNWTLDENGWGLCGAALGLYLADRALMKRGK